MKDFELDSDFSFTSVWAFWLENTYFHSNQNASCRYFKFLRPYSNQLTQNSNELTLLISSPFTLITQNSQIRPNEVTEEIYRYWFREQIRVEEYGRGGNNV